MSILGANNALSAGPYCYICIKGSRLLKFCMLLGLFNCTYELILHSLYVIHL